MVMKMVSKIILLMPCFRDELKGRDNCNPDINIEQKWGKGDGVENQTNPHWTKTDQANEKISWIK